MDEDLKPAYDAARQWRPDADADTGVFQDGAGPAIASVDRRIMADAVVKQIVWSVGGMRDTLALIVQAKGCPDLGDNAAKLPVANPECFSVGQGLRIYQVIDVQRCEIRSNDGARDITTFDIVPGPGVAIDTAVAPADHRVCAI